MITEKKSILIPRPHIFSSRASTPGRKRKRGPRTMREKADARLAEAMRPDHPPPGTL